MDIFIKLGFNFFSDNSLFIQLIYKIVFDTEFAVLNLISLVLLAFTLIVYTIFLVLSKFLPNIFILFKSIKVDYNIFSFLIYGFYLNFYIIHIKLVIF